MNHLENRFAGGRAPTGRNRRPIHLTVLTVAAFAVSGLITAQAITWLLSPHVDPFTLGSPVPLAAAFGREATAIFELGLGLVGMGLAAARALDHDPSKRRKRLMSIVIATTAGMGLLGFTVIPFSGYAFVAFIPLLYLAALGAVGTRRPWLAIGIGLATAGLAIAGHVSGVFPVGQFAVRFAAEVAEAGIAVLSAVSVIAFAGVWVLASAHGFVEGPVPRAVLRYRVPVTIAATACSAPYVIARVSWLTPWPVGGSPTDDPMILVTGLLLGAAMALGGVLTLGLILPWGERFPGWMGRLAGRRVPVPLAVVPAAVVAALFTFGGVGFLVDAIRGSGLLGGGDWLLALVLPFWLWGPLLGLAAWGYELHRSGEHATAVNRGPPRAGPLVANEEE